MTFQTSGIALIALVYFLVRYLNRSDTPRIKNLPEIPGVPIFGNLLQFGDKHAKVAGDLAKKYGAVFQVRLGNRVYGSATLNENLTDYHSESSLRTALIPFVISGLQTSQL